jgi:uncharacterized protein (TIGR00299 family) protein
MKLLYLECAMGAAGDMLMSALYELLPDKEGFIRAMNNTGLHGVTLSAEHAQSQGICGARINVLIHGRGEDEHTHGHDHDAHSHSTLEGGLERISRLNLPESVKTRAARVYGALARAEGEVHGAPPALVHFHEVGALDAIADVCGVCLAAEILGADKIIASPVHTGFGTVKCAHGILPVPAPATAYLLRGIPVYGAEVEGELCTPTGAALLAELAVEFGSMPPMTIDAVGVGVGKKTFPRANILRAFLGSAAERLPGANGKICELTCNIDDMTPEALTFAASRLIELGALDCYLLHGTMKKGRAGHVLNLLCEPRDEEKFAGLIFRYTSTNGLRVKACGKYFLTPEFCETDTPGGKVRVKKVSGFGVTRAKPEYDDVKKLAENLGISYAEAAEICAETKPEPDYSP